MSFKILTIIGIVTLVLIGCDAGREIKPNTHDGRVPDIINLATKVDSVGKLKRVTLTWAYDTITYGTDRIKANLRDWEVWSASDTLQLSPKGRPTAPIFVDVSNAIQPGGNDSIVFFYKIYPNGYTVDNIQFIGKPTSILRIVIKK